MHDRLTNIGGWVVDCARGTNWWTVRLAFDCHLVADPGSPAAVGASEDGSSSLLFGRQKAVGARLKYPVRSCLAASALPLRLNPASGGSVAEENRKHKVQSGKPVGFPGERLWMDYGLVRRRVQKRSFA